MTGGVAFGLSLLCLQADELPEEQAREWKSGNGRYTVQALFHSFDPRTQQVTLKKEDSTSIKVPLARLSTADQSYVKQRAPKSERTAAPQEEVKLHGIKWQPEIEEALKLAESNHQPVMWFRVLGQLDDGM